MDGVLVVDKPAGPTSHDVVARMRRTLQEKRIGHTGTLDPAASGVLPLVVGRATRLARFLSSARKTYCATIRLGVATDTYDADGTALSRRDGVLPDAYVIERTLETFRGSMLQTPPAYSAKKIGGERSHRIARRASAALSVPERPAAVEVTAFHLAIVAIEGPRLRIEIECSAGFYVRTLAHDLGERLGVGAHLEALRRTRSGDFGLADASPLAALEGHPEQACRAIVPLRHMLRSLPAVRLSAEGVRFARHGRVLTPAMAVSEWVSPPDDGGPSGPGEGPIRLLDPDDDLVGLGRYTGMARQLHPFVVLGPDLM